MTSVVVTLDVVEIDRLSDTRQLIELSGIGPQIRIVDQPLTVALEVANVDGIETHQSGKESPVGLGN